MDPQQGIMALPESDQAPAPQLSLDESYGAVRQGLQNANPQASQMLDQTLAKFKPMLAQLDDQTLNSLLQLMQYMKQNEGQYPELLQKIIEAGIVQPGVFPEQYDPEFLATMMMVLTAERKDRQQSTEQAPAQPEMQPPPGMARGGIADAARAAMSQGRGKDSMLAHISPKEAKLLKAHGGMGTTNPATGLKEYGWLDDTIGSISKSVGGVLSGIVGEDISNAVNDLGNSVKDVVRSPVGRLVTTVGLSIVMGPVWGSLATSMLAQDDAETALVNAATAFFASPNGGISNSIGRAGVTNVALNAATTGALVGTGAGLLRGKNLEDSIKAGLTQGAISGATTGLTEGFTTQGTYENLQGTSLDEGAKAGLQQSGMKTYDNVNQLKVDTSQNLIKPNEIVNVGGKYYRASPDASSSNVNFELIHAGTNVNPGTTTGATAGTTTGATNDIRYTYKGEEISASQARALADKGLNPTVVSNARSASEAVARSAATSPASASTAGVTDVSAEVGAGSNYPPFFATPTADGAGAAPASWSATPTADGAVVAKAASVGAPATVTGPPTYGDAFQNMYAGAKKMLPGTDGTFGKGYEQFSEGIGQLYSPSLSNAQLKNTEAYQSAINSKKTVGASLKEAAEAYDPGVMRSYLPGTATALGATYALGGFDVPERPKSEQQTEMESRYKTQKADVAANPGTYTPQGLERFGIKYNDKGEIIGGGSYSLTPLNPTEVRSAPYVPYTPRRYAAAGGIASLAAGGYPRRTGQISGPGTATSDSIPAMLSDGEFVMTAKAVRGAGKGSKLAGAKKMYSLMHQLERNASRK